MVRKPARSACQAAQFSLPVRIMPGISAALSAALSSGFFVINFVILRVFV